MNAEIFGLSSALNQGFIEFARTGYGQYADLIRSTRHLVLPWYHWMEILWMERN